MPAPRLESTAELTWAGRRFTHPLAVVLLAMAGVFGALAVILAVRLSTGFADRDAALVAETRADLAQAIAQVEGLMAAAVPPVEQLVDALGAGMLTADAVDAALAAESLPPWIFGLAVAYEPDAAGTGARLYAPYRVPLHPPEARQIEQSYDYTAFEHRWYRDALFDGAGWREPMYGAASDAMVALYSAPFTTPGAPRWGDPQGVVVATIDLETLAEAVDGVGLGRRGYAFGFSREGRWVVHPLDEWVTGGVTVLSAGRNADEALYEAGIRGLRGGEGQVDHVDPDTGRGSSVLYAPIPGTGWTMGAAVVRSGADQTTQVRTGAIHILLAVMSTLVTLGGWLFMVLGEERDMRWPISIGYTVLLALGVGALWWIADTTRVDESADDATAVLDAAAASRFVDAWQRSQLGGRMEYPITVPTGVFVEAIEFLSAYDVKVTGLIWQRYDDERHADITRSVVLPEADPDSLKLEEAYRAVDGEETHIGWRFSAVLRQQFSYDKYPFDAQDVWLRVLPADFHRNVVLVPDFGSYENLDPSTLPGVEGGLVLPGWTVARSRFEYRLHSYNTDFGLDDYIGQQGFPELYFSVRVVRQFIGPFISNVIPPLVVSIMLFAILLIGTKPPDGAVDWFGFTAKDVVLGCAALFFVVIVDHTALRDRLGSPSLMYFEVYYFALYVALTMVTVNALLFATDRYPWVQYRDNLIPKLMFWPAGLTSVFLTTLVVFY